MQLYFSVKQLGKKKPLILKKAIDIPLFQPLVNLRRLISAIVFEQVSAYNSKEVDNLDEDSSIKFEAAIPLVSHGKIGFGKIYNDKKADYEMALENALQSFEDGLYLVFYGEQEIKSLAEDIDISENNVFSFVRLVFLSGGYF